MLSKSYKQDNTHLNIIFVSKKIHRGHMGTLLPDKNKAFMVRNWFIYLASWNAYETYLNRNEKTRLGKQNQFNIVGGVFREMHSCMWNLVFIHAAFSKTKFMFEYLLSNSRSIKEYSIWSNAQNLWKWTSKQIVLKVFFKGIFQKNTVMLVGCLFKWTNV